MRAWHFSETAWPHLPPDDQIDSIRVTLPNRVYDPKIGAELWDQYLADWLVAEDEGMDIMLNEHHQTASCVDPAAPLVLAALARLTTKARLLVLGNPIANRRQPVRVAEEMALVDVLSKGRVEAGFVRGVPYEVSAANSNPNRMNERHWEALNLIVKAWTHRDGTFSHEGRFFHHRAVNIWPRPYQDPHPPVWVATTSQGGAYQVGQAGYIQACFLTGFGGTRAVFDSYRRGWREAGRGNDIPSHRLAYAGLVYTADTEEKARAGAEKLLWYVRSNKVGSEFSFPPGYSPPSAHVQLLRGAGGGLDPHAGRRHSITVDGAIRDGLLFAGTPDQVYEQIKKFHNSIGGFGHMLNMGQAGFLDHEETAHGIRMFARHVYPRLKDEFPDANLTGFEAPVTEAAE